MRSTDHLRVLALAGLISGLIALSPGTTRADPGFVDKFELLALLEREDFDAIEARLKPIQEAYEAGRIGDTVVDHAFYTFRNSDPALGQVLDHWVKERPDSYMAWMARGNYHLNRGWLSRGARLSKNTSTERFEAMRENFTLAAYDLFGAISINPRLSVAYAGLINLLKTGRADETLHAVMEKGLELNPDSVTIRWQYLFSVQPIWGGSMAKVQAHLARTRREQPNNRDLDHLYGFSDYLAARDLARTGDRRGAVAALGRALEAGDYWFYRAERGRQLRRLGDYDGALADLDRALALRPHVARVFNRRGRVHRNQKRYEESLRDFDAAVRLDRLDPDHLQERAFALRALERFEEAAQDLEDALVFGADWAGIWYDKGLLYLYWLDDTAQAVHDLKRATELNPDSPGNWHEYGVALYKSIDCEFVDALDQYLKLCENGKSCQQKHLEWSRGAIKAMTEDTAECPMQAINKRTVGRVEEFLREVLD
jgi:tetratricopeptide (TPR) repeat protein